MPGNSITLTVAFLQAQNAAPQINGSGGLALLAGVVAIARRKHAIGGWLLYFFCQVILGLLLIAATTHWRRFLPHTWTDPLQYFLFAISNLSRTAVLVEIAVVSLVMFRAREWRWVWGLRYALITYAFLTVVKIVIDFFWFPYTLQLDMLSLTFPCVWILYFELSRRVRRVFLEKSWTN